MIEEEMVVQRRDAKAVVERGRHGRIDFVFEENGVAHHHRATFRFDERGPGAESHERRHRPTIDGNFHIIAREGNFINALLFVELTF